MSDQIHHECGIAMLRLLKPLEFYQIFDGLVYKEAIALEEDFYVLGKFKPAYKIVSRRLQFLRESNKIKYNPKWNKGWEVIPNAKLS